MGKQRMQHCFNCGAELGVFELYPGDVEHCGARECAKEASYQRAAEETEIRERAEADEYDRYR